MKKLRIILCLMLMLTMGSGMLVGCENPPKESNVSSVSLSQAKEIIVNALTLDENNLQTQHVCATNISENRNVFVKFKTASVSIQGNTDFGDTISGEVERQNLNWTKYSLQSSDNHLEYYDGSNAYSKYNTGLNKNDLNNSYFGIILQSFDAIYIDLLFIEDAWATIYKSQVTKTLSNTGYSFAMNIDMPKYVDYVMAKSQELGLGAEGLFGEDETLQKNKDEGSVSLILKFDTRNKMLELSMEINSLGFDGKDLKFVKTAITISKYNHEIKEPEWFNSEDFQ
ncbi:MAG: hypothetical protein ACI4R8_00050 [Candidatus Caccovivens sp.]